MSYKVSFRELAILQKELLSRQSLVTIEKANQQIQTLKKEFIKEQETSVILEYARSNHFLITYSDKTRYLAEGAKQLVYLDEDGRQVTKIE